MKLQPEGASRCLQLLRVGLRSRIGWIDQQGYDARRGDQLVQYLQPLWRHLHVRMGHACDIAARSVEAANEANLYRIKAADLRR